MKLSQAIGSKARTSTYLTLIGLMAAGGIAGQACADSGGNSRVVTVKNADTVIVEDNGRVIYISSPRNRNGSGAASKPDANPKKRVAYTGIGTEEAIRRHNEVVGQITDSQAARPIECR